MPIYLLGTYYLCAVLKVVVYREPATTAAEDAEPVRRIRNFALPSHPDLQPAARAPKPLPVFILTCHHAVKPGDTPKSSERAHTRKIWVVARFNPLAPRRVSLMSRRDDALAADDGNAVKARRRKLWLPVKRRQAQLHVEQLAPPRTQSLAQ